MVNRSLTAVYGRYGKKACNNKANEVLKFMQSRDRVTYSEIRDNIDVEHDLLMAIILNCSRFFKNELEDGEYYYVMNRSKLIKENT